MADHIAVSFDGVGSGIGELTWGQVGIWQSIQRSGASSTIGGVSTVPPGTTVDDVAAILRFIMSRHQSLRTRLRFDAEDGRPRQVVSASGQAVLEVVDVPATADGAAVAAEVGDRYLNTDFDYEHEWPVRMAAIRCGGVVTHSVAVYLHLSIDGAGLDVLLTDLATMDPSPAPVDAVQPLELAGRQRGPAAQRQSEASLRHWERVLRTVAPSRFGEVAVPDPLAPRWRMAGYRSPAARLAVGALAARHDTDSSPVLLAAFAVALADVTGINPVVTLLAVSNRFRPGLAASVCQVAQASPCVVDVSAATFGEVIARARKAALGTYLHAYYDPTRRADLIATVNRDRGVEIDLGCTFNDRRRQAPDPVAPEPTADDLRGAMDLGRYRPIARTDLSRQKLYLGIDDTPGAIDLTLSADTHHVSPADMEAIARGMERVLVDAVLDPTGITDRARQLT